MLTWITPFWAVTHSERVPEQNPVHQAPEEQRVGDRGEKSSRVERALEAVVLLVALMTMKATMKPNATRMAPVDHHREAIARPAPARVTGLVGHRPNDRRGKRDGEKYQPEHFRVAASRVEDEQRFNPKRIRMMTRNTRLISQIRMSVLSDAISIPAAMALITGMATREVATGDQRKRHVDDRAEGGRVKPDRREAGGSFQKTMQASFRCSSEMKSTIRASGQHEVSRRLRRRSRRSRR